MRREEIELLAPAGSYEGFEAAIGAGADAVYNTSRAHTKKPQKYNLFSEYIFTALNLKTRKYIIVFDCSLVLYIICFSY